MSGPVKNYSPEEKARLKKRLTQFYLKYAKNNMSAVDKALTMAISEEELFSKITVKYGSSVEKEANEAKAAGTYPVNATTTQQPPPQQQQPASASASTPTTGTGSVGGSFYGKPIKDYPETEKSRVRKRLANFYSKYAPENMAAVEKALTMSISEEDLFGKITVKYGSSVDQEAREAVIAEVYPAGAPTPASSTSNALSQEPQSQPTAAATTTTTEQPQQQQPTTNPTTVETNNTATSQQQQQPSGNNNNNNNTNNTSSTTTTTTTTTTTAFIKDYSAPEKDRVRARLTNFYKQYAPENMVAVEKALTMSISEEELFGKITTKYGSNVEQEANEAKAAGVYPVPPPPPQSLTSAPTSTTTTATTQQQQQQQVPPMSSPSYGSGPIKDYTEEEKSRLRKRLTNFYTKYAPENMTAVEKALTMSISESELFEKITGKYGSSVEKEATEAKEAGVYPSAASHHASSSSSSSAPPPQQQQQQQQSYPTASGPIKNYSPAEKDRVRTRLTNFYKTHAPENMAAVEKAIAMSITEEELLEKITTKYGSNVEQEANEAKAAGCYAAPPSLASASSNQQQQQPSSSSSSSAPPPSSTAEINRLMTEESNEQPLSEVSSLAEAHQKKGVRDLLVSEYSQSEKTRFKQRLTQLYSKYHPPGLENVEKALGMNFTEEVILEKICTKYNIDNKKEFDEARKANLLPGSSNVRDLIGEDKDRVRARIELFYAHHNPAGKQQGVDDAMRMDRTEQAVLDHLCTRYHVHPSVELSVAYLSWVAPNCKPSNKPSSLPVSSSITKSIVNSGEIHLRNLSSTEKNRAQKRFDKFFDDHPATASDPKIETMLDLEMSEAELMLRLCMNHSVPVHVEALAAEKLGLLPSSSTTQQSRSMPNNDVSSTTPTTTIGVNSNNNTASSGYGKEPVTKDPFEKKPKNEDGDGAENVSKYKISREEAENDDNHQQQESSSGKTTTTLTAEQESALASSVFAGAAQSKTTNKKQRNDGPGEDLESSENVPLASQMETARGAIVLATVQLPPKTDRVMLQSASPPYPEQFAEALLADLRSLVATMGCTWVEYLPSSSSSSRADGGVAVRLAFKSPMAAASFVNWVRTSVPGGGSGYGGCSFAAPKSRVVYQAMGGRPADFSVGFLTDPKLDPSSSSASATDENDFSPPRADEGDHPSEVDSKKPFHPSQASINQEVFEILKLSSSVGNSTPLSEIEAKSRQRLEENDPSYKRTNVFAVTGKSSLATPGGVGNQNNNNTISTSGSIASAFPSAATMNVADSSSNNNNNNTYNPVSTISNPSNNLSVTPPLQQRGANNNYNNNSSSSSSYVDPSVLLPDSTTRSGTGIGNAPAYREDGTEKFSQSEKDVAMKNARDYLMAAGSELAHRLEEVAKTEKECATRAAELDKREADVNKKMLAAQEKEDACASLQRKFQLAEKDLDERESYLRKMQQDVETQQQELEKQMKQLQQQQRNATTSAHANNNNTSTSTVGTGTVNPQFNNTSTSVTPIHTSSTGIDASPNTIDSSVNTVDPPKTRVTVTGTSPMPGPSVRAHGTSPLPPQPQRNSATSPLPKASTRNTTTGITPDSEVLFANDKANEARNKEYMDSLENQLREATNTIHELQMVIGDRDQAARSLASETAHHAAQVEDLRARSSRVEQAEVAVRQREERCMQREKELGRMLEQVAQQKKMMDSTQAKQLQDATTGLAVGIGMSSSSTAAAGGGGDHHNNNNNISMASPSRFLNSSNIYAATSPGGSNNNNNNGNGRFSSVTNVAGRLYPSSSVSQQQQQQQQVFGGPRVPSNAQGGGGGGGTFGTSTSSSSPRRALADDEIAALVRRVQDREVALRRVIDDEHTRRMGNYYGGGNGNNNNNSVGRRY